MQESNSSPVNTEKRRHSAAFKRTLLELIEQPGVSVGDIALEHRVNANWVFRWRRARREHKLAAGTVRQTVLLLVTVDPQESLLAAALGGHVLVAKEGAIKIKSVGSTWCCEAASILRVCAGVLMALRETA